MGGAGVQWFKSFIAGCVLVLSPCLSVVALDCKFRRSPVSASYYEGDIYTNEGNQLLRCVDNDSCQRGHVVVVPAGFRYGSAGNTSFSEEKVFWCESQWENWDANIWKPRTVNKCTYSEYLPFQNGTNSWKNTKKYILRYSYADIGNGTYACTSTGCTICEYDASALACAKSKEAALQSDLSCKCNDDTKKWENNKCVAKSTETVTSGGNQSVSQKSNEQTDCEALAAQHKAEWKDGKCIRVGESCSATGATAGKYIWNNGVVCAATACDKDKGYYLVKKNGVSQGWCHTCPRGQHVNAAGDGCDAEKTETTTTTEDNKTEVPGTVAGGASQGASTNEDGAATQNNPAVAADGDGNVAATSGVEASETETGRSESTEHESGDTAPTPGPDNVTPVAKVIPECPTDEATQIALFEEATGKCWPSQCKSARYKLTDPRTAWQQQEGAVVLTQCAGCRQVTIGTTCEDQVGKECETSDKNAQRAEYRWDDATSTLKCVITKCKTNYKLDGDTCVDELRDNAQKMRDKEQSTANKLIGAAGIGATGIGTSQALSALAEQRADQNAEDDMRAYLATFKCDYGMGKNINGGDMGIELPGGNELTQYVTQYKTLASDLKLRKEALGISPGIESETIIDAADTGLYDNAATGKTDGAFTSLSRALSDETSADAAAWEKQKADTASKLKTSATVAAVGAVGSAIANLAVNGADKSDDKSDKKSDDKSDEKKDKTFKQDKD